MGDRLTTIDMAEKWGSSVPLSGGAGPPFNTMSPEPRPNSVTIGILNPSNSLATIDDIGRKLMVVPVGGNWVPN